MPNKLKRFSGAAVGRMMKVKGLSVQQFAGMMIQEAKGTVSPSPQYVSAIIEGEVKRPSCDYVLLMAHVLDCTIDDLVEVVK